MLLVSYKMAPNPKKSIDTVFRCHRKASNRKNVDSTVHNENIRKKMLSKVFLEIQRDLSMRHLEQLLLDL